MAQEHKKFAFPVEADVCRELDAMSEDGWETIQVFPGVVQPGTSGGVLFVPVTQAVPAWIVIARRERPVIVDREGDVC